MLLVLALVARSIARNWAAFQSVQVTLSPRIGWLAASVAVVFLTYAIQIESWRQMLRGWDQRLPYTAAARAWTLSNLGRYIPGKVWSVAGLVVLAERAGVRRSVAAVSAFAMQAVVLGTGVVIVAIATPHAASPLLLGGAVLAALALIGVLAWRRTALWLGRLADAATPLPPLPLTAIILSSGAMLLSWATFGLAFWMLIRGLMPTATVPAPAAMGMFALGYVLGIVAIIAPGGIGVRDLALVGFLTPFLGSGGALAVSLASRVQLTFTEAGGAGIALLLKPAGKEILTDRPPDATS
ncbi:MAG: lysylphosphatidylglycerol synthase domain-containing protein [Gemmatimonadales bacterium]